MTDAQAAVGMDRLPWLDDEPAHAPRATPKPVPSRPLPKTTTGGRELAGWAVAAALLVAGGSYWLGTRSVGGPSSAPQAESGSTIRLPEAERDVQPQVALAPAPEVKPAPTPTVGVPKSPVRRDIVRKRKLSPMEMKGSDLSKTVQEQEGTAAKPEPAKAAPAPAASAQAPAKPQPLRLWPSTESKGASGRVVRIGAFGTRQQAKLGWRRMQRAYPAVGRLPATVVTDRNSHGRNFYRFQIGTTSQAHSEVLCQRMQKIRFSCAVVGLPWKAKVER